MEGKFSCFRCFFIVFYSFVFSSSCQTITRLINQDLFNAQEGDVVVTEADLRDDPQYGPDHPLKKSEAERQALVRQAMNVQKMDRTWISSEFLMGKINIMI